jgi:hypothetical protein
MAIFEKGSFYFGKPYIFSYNNMLVTFLMEVHEAKFSSISENILLKLHLCVCPALHNFSRPPF